ncbi:MAG TPA: hypothetical protein DD979_15460, partial [Gammaproteobacteria bacterium]|nr:hypothetical protein [Gammaproteobacteria bacterium]
MFLTAGLSAGGAEKVTVTLANRLSRSCSVSVICVYPGGVNADYLNAEVNLLRADKPRILAALPFVIRTLKRTRAAFLVCNKDDVAVLGALAIVLSRTDTQLIARVANKPVYYYRAPFWRKFGYYCLFKGMYRYAHRVICVSESLRREILSLYQLDPDKVKVIYNPPGVIRSNPELRPTLTTPESTSVVTIGRLVAQKNHFLFIDTLKALSRVGNYEGFIVGEGPLRSALEAHAAACGIAERIHFVEYVDDPVSY